MYRKECRLRQDGSRLTGKPLELATVQIYSACVIPLSLALSFPITIHTYCIKFNYDGSLLHRHLLSQLITRTLHKTVLRQVLRREDLHVPQRLLRRARSLQPMSREISARDEDVSRRPPARGRHRALPATQSTGEVGETPAGDVIISSKCLLEMK